MADTVKFNLRIPADLHQAATETASRLGISLNAFAVLGLRNWVEYQGGKLDKARPLAGLQATATAASPLPAQAARAKQKAPAKVRWNQPCPCGIKKPYKLCHGAAEYFG